MADPKSPFEREQVDLLENGGAVLDADVDEKDMTDDEREYFERLRLINS